MLSRKEFLRSAIGFVGLGLLAPVSGTAESITKSNDTLPT